jgi:uncharacterized Zn finger protein (UPF0148 family)
MNLLAQIDKKLKQWFGILCPTCGGEMLERGYEGQTFCPKCDKVRNLRELK